MNILHYLDQPILPPVGSKQWIDKKATTPALTMLKESRPTSETSISPTFDDDWGPSKVYHCIVYLPLIIGLIAGSIFESSVPTVVTGNPWDEGEMSRGIFISSVLTSAGR